MPSNIQLNYCLLLCITLMFSNVINRSVNYYEICGGPENKRLYVEPGKKGIAVMENDNTGHKQDLEFYQQCKLELISCPACIIYVNFVFLNLSQSCVDKDNLNPCGCGYVWIYEPSYETASGRQFCGSYSNNHTNVPLFFKSKTHAAVIIFLKKHFHAHAFTLQYSAERNRRFIQGLTGENNTASKAQVMSTPFFPEPYLKDLNMEFVISCEVPRNCMIRIIFNDFLIAKMSVIEFFDSKGQRVDIVTGLSFRPSIIISASPTLTVRFYANGASNKGFKATISFLSADQIPTKPNMDCGGLVDNLGGTISLTTEMKHSGQPYDCVWVTQLSRKFLHFYTHSYLKVIDFSDFAGKAEMSIHQSPTSASAAKEILSYPFPSLVQPAWKEHVLPILQGIYINFKGALNADSKLEIAYTAFSYNDCTPGTDFFCKNQRCIPIYLQCDGYDHCGDNSDELESCSGSEGKNGPRRWSSSNFLPKTDQYSDVYAAAVMFIVCFFALTVLILTLIFFLSRTNGPESFHREIRNNLQVINDLLEQENPSGIQEEEVIIEDDPPVYEPPPSYNEITDSLRRSRERLSTKELRLKCRSMRRRETCSMCSRQLNTSKLQYNKIKMEQNISCCRSSTSQGGSCYNVDLSLAANSTSNGVGRGLETAKVQTENVNPDDAMPPRD